MNCKFTIRLVKSITIYERISKSLVFQGMLADGTEFDNTYKRRHPVIFIIGRNNVRKHFNKISR